MRVLIFKVNQLGDNVVFLPVVQEIRRRYPHWELAVVTSPTAAPLYRDAIDPSRLIVAATPKFNSSWKNPISLAKLWRRVAGFAPDACLIADDQANVAYLLSYLSGSPLRVALKQSFIKVGRLANVRLLNQPDENIALVNWRVAGALVERLGEGNWPERPTPPDLSHLLKPGIGPPSGPPRIVIHPGASHPYQCWFPERYVELANRLQAAGRWQVDWIETPGLAPKGLSAGAHRVATPALQDLVQTLHGAALFVGNNSGPMHIANAVGCRCVIINGPTKYDWDPLWHARRMLMLRDSALPCLPCEVGVRPIKICRNYADPMACMKFWSVDSIYERCVDWVQRVDQPMGGPLPTLSESH